MRAPTRTRGLTWLGVALLALALASPDAAAAGKRKKRDRKGKDKVEQPATTEPAGEAPGEAPPAAEPEGVAAPSAAAPAAAPAPPPAAKAKTAPAADSPAEAEAAATAADGGDVDALRGRYEKIRERLFTSRATSAAVGDALYSARVRIHLRYVTPRFFGLKRVTIRLDGANVYDDTAGAIAEDDAPRFETFVAPGKHVITVRIEAVSKDDERLGSTIEDSFTLDVPADQLTTVKARAGDDGDIGYAWKRKAKGSYKLHLDVAVTTGKLEEGGGGKK